MFTTLDADIEKKEKPTDALKNRIIRAAWMIGIVVVIFGALYAGLLMIE